MRAERKCGGGGRTKTISLHHHIVGGDLKTDTVKLLLLCSMLNIEYIG